MLLSRLVAVVATLAAAVTSATPAEARSATPPARALHGTTVDAPATWERESGCDPVEKKGPKKLRRLLLRTYGPVASNIVRSCSASDWPGTARFAHCSRHVAASAPATPPETGASSEAKPASAAAA